MPDLDAIRGQSTLVVASLEWRVNPDAAGLHHNIPHAVIDAAHSMALHVPDLLAALATAEEENAILMRDRDEFGLKLIDAEARADAAERRAERMLAAVVTASHTVIPDNGAEWMNGFAAGQRAMRAALARAEGENATRTGDPRPEGSGEG